MFLVNLRVFLLVHQEQQVFDSYQEPLFPFLKELFDNRWKIFVESINFSN